MGLPRWERKKKKKTQINKRKQRGSDKMRVQKASMEQACKHSFFSPLFSFPFYDSVILSCWEKSSC